MSTATTDHPGHPDARPDKVVGQRKLDVVPDTSIGSSTSGDEIEEGTHPRFLKEDVGGLKAGLGSTMHRHAERSPRRARRRR